MMIELRMMITMIMMMMTTTTTMMMMTMMMMMRIIMMMRMIMKHNDVKERYDGEMECHKNKNATEKTHRMKVMK